jgi:hypothetical protein
MAAADPFYGVTRGSHIGSLERLYKVINPEKVHQVTLMLDKFGLGIWASLKSKYPEVPCCWRVRVVSRSPLSKPACSSFRLTSIRTRQNR